MHFIFSSAFWERRPFLKKRSTDDDAQIAFCFTLVITSRRPCEGKLIGDEGGRRDPDYTRRHSYYNATKHRYTDHKENVLRALEHGLLRRRHARVMQLDSHCVVWFLFR